MKTAPKRYPNKILQAPMRGVCQKLQDMDIDMTHFRALEFFAREGDWQTVSYAGKVASLDAWEINPECEVALKRNLPNAKIRIGDSYEFAKLPEFAHQFDFIVFDNPQLTFGKKNEYCEHFEALEMIPFLLKNRGIVVFNVNTSPYDYEKHPEWQRRRKTFYKTDATEKLSLDFLEKFYAQYFRAKNFRPEFIFFEPRHEGMVYYCIAELIQQKLIRKKEGSAILGA
ncbi:MAG: hypothetical protein ACOY3I_08605 [Verrucomicrobiota bacterium]